MKNIFIFWTITLKTSGRWTRAWEATTCCMAAWMMTEPTTWMWETWRWRWSIWKAWWYTWTTHCYTWETCSCIGWSWKTRWSNKTTTTAMWSWMTSGMASWMANRWWETTWCWLNKWWSVAWLQCWIWSDWTRNTFYEN